jgi:regulator of cell morphogenesis and NO signaling
MQDFDRRISEIVQADYRTAEVFKKYRLTYCCGADLSLRTACEGQGLDYDYVVKELTESTRNLQLSAGLSFQKWRIDFLIDFIGNVHHAYAYEVLPSLSTGLQAFAVSHRKKYPHLEEVADLVNKLSDMLIAHNKHEDEIIFPYIKQINRANEKKEAYGNLFVRTLRKPLEGIDREHEQMQEILDRISALTNHFAIPEKACTSFQVYHHRLKEFYDNMAQHTYLEHDILFPRAIAIEQQLLEA